MSISVRCFFELIRRELYLFSKEFVSKLINIAAILCTWVIVFGYFMGKEGLTNYGGFIFVGSFATFGFFETIFTSMIFAQDLIDEKISNYLILPLPSSYVFIATSISWSISICILALFMLPLGKLILWNQFNFSHICIFKFIIIFISGNLFYGFFSLWISSIVSNLRNTTWIWARLINPLFMFCGYFYTWKTAYALSPVVGYLHFLNPLVFILEGTKAAVLGQKGFLPFWACFFAIWVFTLFFTYDAIRRIKRRVDYV